MNFDLMEKQFNEDNAKLDAEIESHRIACIHWSKKRYEADKKRLFMKRINCLLARGILLRHSALKWVLEGD
jgi:hypothetical protein